MTDLTSLHLPELRALRDEYAAVMLAHRWWGPRGGHGCHSGDQRSWDWAERGFRACCEEQLRRHRAVTECGRAA